MSPDKVNLGKALWSGEVGAAGPAFAGPLMGVGGWGLGKGAGASGTGVSPADGTAYRGLNLEMADTPLPPASPVDNACFRW